MENFDNLVKLFSDNIEWVFSGVGVFVLSLFFVKNGVNKKQRAGKNSNNYMADRDINVGTKNDNK
ncbi:MULTISPECIES: hypothetical protein [Aeromonas]|jgi:hypothetical protein|uniref:Uncharacterized protein n=1 Tax=Aeromonas caviae TaxID=648 RepID=A0A7T3X0H5_AERCA|nr:MULTISPECIES: hypothetical protein [Aeromonas]MBP6791096.1 hypothetical protein [Aeromonas sp.]MEA9418991.1 hypothetical protein [Aeromonas caviae]QQA59977.1 hypothetical protein JC965_17325 [Aeromonas caviae]UCM51666.1 hypothetical protein LEO81_12520 [Aeromonas dhakensis]WEE23516.1 hypothetical protein PY772_08735 [Aeromonas caviae]